MAVTYAPKLKTSRMTATRNDCADGALEILTAADAVLVSLGLSAAAGTVTDDTWTLTFDGTAVASGPATGTAIATRARIKMADGTVAISGLTVAMPPPQGQPATSDVTLDNTSIAKGQTVSVGVVTIKHAPDPV